MFPALYTHIIIPWCKPPAYSWFNPRTLGDWKHRTQPRTVPNSIIIIMIIIIINIHTRRYRKVLTVKMTERKHFEIRRHHALHQLRAQNEIMRLNKALKLNSLLTDIQDTKGKFMKCFSIFCFLAGKFKAYLSMPADLGMGVSPRMMKSLW